jgi:hypothetical protein
MYASTITECIHNDQNLGGYADDHYIVDSFRPSQDNGEAECVRRMQDSLVKVNDWMASNVLKMNATKTEVTLFGSRQMLSRVSTKSIQVAGEDVAVSQSMKYLGVWIDSELNLKEHIKNKCKTAINNIRVISRIRNFIDMETAKLLSSALVLSHLDFSNSVLCGLPTGTIDMLQRVQNWSAKVVLRRAKSSNSLDALQTLHWLPIKERIDFKILCLVFRCFRNTAPEYLSSLLKFKTFQRNTRASVSAPVTLDIPFTKKSTFANRAFSVYGPRLWNSLPVNVRSVETLLNYTCNLDILLFLTLLWG